MALGRPQARPASPSLSPVATGVGGKVSCWVALRHRRRFSPPLTPPCVLLLCVLAVWLLLRGEGCFAGL